MSLTTSQYTPLRVILILSMLSTILFLYNLWRLYSNPEISSQRSKKHKQLYLLITAILLAAIFGAAIIRLLDYIKEELIFLILLVTDLLLSAGK